MGAEAKRLVKKVRALARDNSPSSLEAFQVEEARLRLWVRVETSGMSICTNQRSLPREIMLPHC